MEDALEDWLNRPEGMAARLRALRVEAGLTGKQLAERYSWAQSKVSRIENGKQLPSPEDVERWAEACGAGPGDAERLQQLRRHARTVAVMLRDRMRDGQAEVQLSHNRLHEASHTIRYFETAFVPGILQIPTYARRILTEMITLHELQIDDVDAAVSARMQRQSALYDPTKRYDILIAEPVLRWALCPPAVMRAQLDRLHAVIGLDRLRFGVIPLEGPVPITPQNAVQLYVGEETVAATETLIGQTWHRGAEAEAYARAVDLLWDEAVTGDDARALIVAAGRALPG